jgi:fructokinase
VFNILGIGELLWDMLPAGPQLGGAPANYTVMAGRLGNHASIISRIGSDDLGQGALEVLKPFPVDCALLQLDAEHTTGSVTVELKDGQPSYIIHQPVAWDFFELTDMWLAAAAKADAVCFGSLGQRSERSRTTIHSMVKATGPKCQRIFDVNLRAPFYNAQIVRESLELATVMKMNDQEVPLVLELLGMKRADSLREGAERILEGFNSVQLVAITCGGEGSLLVGRSEWHQHPGIATKVADTIGAGDAFTAAMTHYLLRGAPLSVLNEAGNRWGSYIASRSGAMPEIDDETIRQMERAIEG